MMEIFWIDLCASFWLHKNVSGLLEIFGFKKIACSPVLLKIF
jgi:hypothetical protein